MVMDQMQEIGPIREPIVDGIFYPAEPEALLDEIRRLLAQGTVPPGEAEGILAPHASLTYCGTTIAAAYRGVSGRKVSNVVLLGPVYRDPEPALIMPESEAFSSPLGTIRVVDILEESKALGGLPIVRRDIPHLEEHCLEIHLPFIQYLFPDAGVVPILVGEEGEVCRNAVRRLIETLYEERESLLVVVSFNLTSTVDLDGARREAGIVVDALLSNDTETLLSGEKRGTLSARGLTSVIALLEAWKGSHRIELLARQSSSAQLDDPTSTVEYGSFALTPQRGVPSKSSRLIASKWLSTNSTGVSPAVPGGLRARIAAVPGIVSIRTATKKTATSCFHRLRKNSFRLKRRCLSSWFRS